MFLTSQDDRLLRGYAALPGKKPYQIAFYFVWAGFFGQTQTEADAFDVGVHGDALMHYVGVGQHHVGCFPGHTGQSQHLFHGAGHFSRVGGHERYRCRSMGRSMD